MRVMDELTEAAHRREVAHRRTPSFQYAGGQSPRVGSSCAGAVYHLIQDWTLSKRFSSTKRIVAGRPIDDNLYARRDGSFTEHTNTAAAKLPLTEDAVSTSQNTPPALQTKSSPASGKSDAKSKRSPGVVARLMGLDSFPERSSSKSGTSQSEAVSKAPSPVLLQELLRVELQQSKKSLKEKLPSFTKKGLDAKGAVSQKKKPGAHVGKRELSYANSGALRNSTVPEGLKDSVKQPFLARLQRTDAPPMPPTSISQNSPSPILSSASKGSHSPIVSPSMLGGKNAVRLLEVAVKTLEVPMAQRKKYSITTNDSHESENRRPEKRTFGASSNSRGGSPANSATKVGRGQSRSRKDDRAESNSSGSRSTFRAPSRQVNRTVGASSSPLQSHRPRTANPKIVEESPRTLLRSHESSIRGFKTDLGEYPLGKKLKRNDSCSQAVAPEELPGTLSPNTKTNSREPYTPDQNPKPGTSQRSPGVVPEKPRGFRSMRFRSGSGKQVKPVAPSPPKETGEVDCKDEGKHGSPSEEKLMAPSPPKEAKVAGFSYNMLFKKPGNKKEGNESGEALVIKRTDGAWMRQLLSKPSSIPWTSKSSKKVNVEVMESVELQEASVQEPALSPTDQQEGANALQAKCRSIDDVFPELPMEEKDARRASPELGTTIRAVEELQLLRQGDVDYRSIERMFGKEFSRSIMAADLTSPEVSPAPESSTESGVPGTFPNSPKYDSTNSFSSRSQLNLHDMFEVISENRSHESTSCRRSFCLSEPRERVLNEEEAEEAESDNCSNSVSCTPEHLENHKMSVFAGWMTPPALREFEEKLAHEDMMSTPSAVKTLEERLKNEGAMSTPPAVKRSEEEPENEGALSTPPALKKFEEKLALEDVTTPPALKKFEEKLAREGVMTPPASKNFEEKLAREGVVTPPALKKFEENLAQGFADVDDSHALCPDEFGQPSPVSVLQSPFLDEVPTTPDTSLTEAQHVGDKKPSPVEDNDEDETPEASIGTSQLSNAGTPEIIQTDMIEQAILDISRIRRIDVTSIGLERQIIANAPIELQREKNYIREVLDLSREGELSWPCAANQSLFQRLEFGSKKQGPSVRSERKLLFDSVHEVVALEPWLKTSSFYVELPMFPDLHANSKFRSPISGEELAHEVHRMFCHWKDIAGNCLDDLIDYDMNVPEGRWVNFGHEVADIGSDIERTLLHVLIAEVVDDLTSLIATRD